MHQLDTLHIQYPKHDEALSFSEVIVIMNCIKFVRIIKLQ
jgi:hypothetical protein